ncbi:unnamed protein product [Eruca vesicaria subsp. sativa]|uniref:C2 PI3K-type domain-containing protein n=1 Tax=Eruca vesicaria subsp. sativa TaxID=29727 RepID=A0ABC8JG53_ERUVS|nr:unnamed protein product [Eruca vesicaria subsp. sativa]
MVLPLMKLGTLLVKTISKPLASQLKHQAKVYPRFRQSTINFAQGFDVSTSSVLNSILNIIGSPYCWNELITLSSKYRDLTAHSQLAITVWDVSCGKAEGLIGGATILLFNSKVQMKSGKQKLRLWQGKEADGSFSTSTLGKRGVKYLHIDIIIRLSGDASTQNGSSFKLVPAQKIEPLTVSELNQYTLTSESQKLQREISSFTCLFCDKPDAVCASSNNPLPKYRVELSVSENTDDVVPVTFDL